MKFRIIIKLISAVLILCSILASCAPKTSSTQFFAMDTLMEITAYGENSDDAIKECEAEVNRLEKIFSADLKNSELSGLNIDKKSEASDELAKIIIKSDLLSKATDGNFDIKLRELISLWGFVGSSDSRVPEDSEIKDFLAKDRALEVFENSVALNNCAIDLGAVAKGYTSLKLSDILSNNGIKSAIINLGGNIRLVGKNPSGNDWKIGIKNPDGSNQYFGILLVSDTSVITSGGYQRYFEQDGKRYHHILNPKTGYPADSGLQSVTIICSDDVIADAFSTAIFVGGAELAKKLKAQYNIEYVLVDSNNDIILSDGIYDKFELTDTNYKIKSK